MNLDKLFEDHSIEFPSGRLMDIYGFKKAIQELNDHPSIDSSSAKAAKARNDQRREDLEKMSGM